MHIFEDISQKSYSMQAHCSHCAQNVGRIPLVSTTVDISLVQKNKKGIGMDFVKINFLANVENL